MTLILLLLLAGAPKGGTLYVKGNAVVLHAKADLKSKALGNLKNGDAVVWVGPAASRPALHEITVNGKHGFVAVTELSAWPAVDEKLRPAFAPQPSDSAAPQQDQEQAVQLELLRASSRYQADRVAEGK